MMRLTSGGLLPRFRADPHTLTHSRAARPGVLRSPNRTRRAGVHSSNLAPK
jgi:hypothetical protein